MLQQIHRAIVTAPAPDEIPNIDFTFSVRDHPTADTWSLARSDAPGEVNNTWLMPDYAYWSWPEPRIGALADARERIVAVDGPRSWSQKHDVAVWRGSTRWNTALRGKLLEVARGKPWSDVQELDWKVNALAMEDFCAYKFLIYTEVRLHPFPRTYSLTVRAGCDIFRTATILSALSEYHHHPEAQVEPV